MAINNAFTGANRLVINEVEDFYDNSLVRELVKEGLADVVAKTSNTYQNP
jgi:hypothetical protein